MKKESSFTHHRITESAHHRIIMRLINFNGSVQSENIPLVYAWNRAFRYGDGLFESIAVGEKSIPFFDDHWSRLTQAAQLLSLELPINFTKEFLRKAIPELLSLNTISGNAYARVMLYREGRGRYAPDEMQAGFMLEVEPIQGALFQLNEKGLNIGLFTDVSKSVDQLSNFKTNSAVAYVLASIHKTKMGFDDCLLLNTRSNICDSTNSNVFLVKDKIISTPALSEGCINGVMRKQVITLANENGFSVNATAIEAEMLRHADEVFLTNAVNGIRWVHRYGNKEYDHKIASTLSGALKKRVS